MDPLNRGILNVIESVINNLFVREPSVNGIQQWINSCKQNNGSPLNRDPAIASVQGHSTSTCPITTRLSPKKSPVIFSRAKSNSINVNSSTTVDSGYKLMGKNARKKMRRRAALNENHSGSIDPSESECDQKKMRRRAALNENHSGLIDPSKSECEVPDVTKVGDEKMKLIMSTPMAISTIS
jgi:hypothetical protein